MRNSHFTPPRDLSLTQVVTKLLLVETQGSELWPSFLPFKYVASCGFNRNAASLGSTTPLTVRSKRVLRCNSSQKWMCHCSFKAPWPFFLFYLFLQVPHKNSFGFINRLGQNRYPCSSCVKRRVATGRLCMCSSTTLDFIFWSNYLGSIQGLEKLQKMQPIAVITYLNGIWQLVLA